MYLLNTTTGNTERWTTVTDTPDRDVGHAIVDYWASEDGAWLFAHDGDLVRALNRASGLSWGWADGNIAMYDALANRLVLENRIFEHRTSGPIVVMDGEMHVAGRCAVGPAYSRQALLSKDGTHVVIVSQPSPPDPNAVLEVKDEQPAACDVASGALTAMPGPPVPPVTSSTLARPSDGGRTH
jgi:hypothetical protein